MAKRKPIRRASEIEYEDWQQITDAAGRKSELECVLLLTSVIEHALATMLREFFVQNEYSETTLSTTLDNGKRKLDIAFCVGLISSEQRDEIAAIFKIRNEFAHSSSRVSFNDETVIGFCNSNALRQRRFPPGIRFGGKPNPAEQPTPGNRAKIRFLKAAIDAARLLMADSSRVRPMTQKRDQ
jgi:hypothetical protein